MTKLGYDKSDNRWTKMVKGQRFRSSRGASKTLAIAEFVRWLTKTQQIDPQDAREIESVSQIDNAVRDSLTSVGLDWSSNPEVGRAMWSGATKLQSEKKLPPTDDSLASMVTRFVAAKSSKVSANRARSLGIHLAIYQESVGTGLIPTLEQWDKFCGDITSGKSKAYQRDIIGSVRCFFRWMFDLDLIASMPKCVFAKHYTVTVPAVRKDTLTPENIRDALSRADDQLRLILLLMLNTGSTQKDISELDWSQIDLTAGTLTRMRTKHKHRSANSNTPIVTYTLWSDTIALLQEHALWADGLALIATQGLEFRSGRVFSTKKGLPLVGENDRRDDVMRQYKAIGGPLTPNQYRKYGATVLGSSPHRAYREMFLANAGDKITDGSYDRNTVLPAVVTQCIRDSF